MELEQNGADAPLPERLCCARCGTVYYRHDGEHTLAAAMRHSSTDGEGGCNREQYISYLKTFVMTSGIAVCHEPDQASDVIASLMREENIEVRSFLIVPGARGPWLLAREEALPPHVWKAFGAA